MDNTESCAVCQQPFTHQNVAWIIPMCDHNICNLCLKNCMALKATSLTCKICNQKHVVDEEILQQFPKNITILKNLRESKNASMISQDSASNRKLIQSTNMQGSMLLSDSSVKYISNSCPKHGKPLQIICIIDRNLLCAHCALFGEHHNHTFKTIQQFDAELMSFGHRFKQIQMKKQATQQSVKGKKFRANVVNKITERRDRLVLEIKNKFSKIYALVKDAENKAFQQLVKCFRSVDIEISKLIKQEQDIEKLFTLWKKQTADFLKVIQEVVDLKSKIQVFYKQEKPLLTNGETYLKEIQTNSKLIRNAIQQKIDSIKVDYAAGIQGIIFNYANVTFNPVEISVSRVKDQQIYSASVMDEAKKNKKQMKIQFVKSAVIDSSKQIPMAIGRKQDPLKLTRTGSNINTLHKVKSNPKLPKVNFNDKSDQPKKPLTPPKSIVSHNAPLSSSKQQQQQKHAQNLAFAQRMLNQFINNSDTLDITGCELGDDQLVHIVESAAQQKPIKCLKLLKNKLSTQGLSRILQHLSSATNVNLSYNLLTDECIDLFVDRRVFMPCLRIINLAHNKINQRKVKSKMEQLKKVGVIITL